MAGDIQITPNEILDFDKTEPTTEIQPENMVTEHLEMPNLTEDTEFKGLIPPLTNDEYLTLKESIKADGCHDPLIVWKGQNIILDGHHRYKICVELGLPFKITEIEFLNRTEVKIWMIKNQRGRRNLNESQRAMLAVQLEALYSEQAKERMGTRTDLSQNLDQSEVGKSADKAANDMGISHQTVSFAKKVVNKGIPKLTEMVESGDVAVSAAARVASNPPEVQEKIVEKAATQIQEGNKPKITALIREIAPETKDAQKNDASKLLEKFRKNQEANQKLLEGIEITNRPENLTESLSVAENILARLREIGTKFPDPSNLNAVHESDNPQIKNDQGSKEENSEIIDLVEDGVEGKYADDGLESIEDDSPDSMDDPMILPTGWE
jgi:ParB-like chromosome segregation protein Spo0J